MNAPRLLFEASIQDGNRFSGVAYSGGIIPRWGAMVIDLDTTKVEPSMPVMLDHEGAAASVAGVVESHTVDLTGLSVAGVLHTDVDEDAKAVVERARRGNRYQMSVGLYEYSEYFAREGERVSVNGRVFVGPLTVLKNGIIREVSITALGADRNTAVQFFSESATPTQPAGDPNVKTAQELQNELDAANATITELRAAVAALEGRVTAAEAQSAAVRASARTAAVKALFAETGREFKEGAEKPYLAMADEDFDVVAGQMREGAKQTPTLPASLFSHTATGTTGTQNKGLLVQLAEGRRESYAKDRRHTA